MRMIRTRSSLNGGEGTAQSGIGVVGMACVFPDAHSPEELWESVLAGRRAFRMLPRERVPRDLYFDHDPKTPDKTYSDQVAVITDWSFDPLAFQVPPVTVEATDPTHWLALSTAAAAFRDAGLGLERTDRSRIAVVLGNSLGGEYGRSTYLRYRWPFVERALRRALEYLGRSQEAAVKDLLTTFRHYYLSPFPETTEDSLAGAMSNTIAGRICAQFDLGGGGYTIDGACASSLLAVATACDMLTSGTVDLVLAGGVDISLDPFELVGFAKTTALAEEDIRPYDARAAGMLPGEGCGLVALMRLSDARDSGYRTRAVIRGWGHSTDGRGGITEPQRAGQVLALRRAYERAGYPIATVSLIEGHGTGTARGDQVELNAIIDLLAEGSGEGHCTIGSVKGNIGHCKAAAGAAGLIKTVMALEHKILPPMAACERPSPIFDRSRGRLRPALDGGAWDRGATPRRASVSAFGFGGSNAHIALEESDPPTAPSPDQLALLATAQSTELVILSAADREGLSQRVSNIARVASRLSRAEMTDLAGALADTDGAEAWRIAVVAESPWHLATVLRRAAAALATGAPVADLNDAGAGVLAGTVRGGEPPPRLVGLFPGQGAQRLGMGRHLARRYPFTAQMYAAFDEAIDLAEGLTVWMLRDDRLVEDESAERWNARLRATELAQPAIVAASLAMLAVLDFHGLRPDIVIGHSVGEISALSAAGVFDAVTAVRIAAWRGEAMAGLALRDPGGMMAIQAEAPRVEELLAIAGPDLAISGYNSPRQTVVSGGGEALARLERTCARFGTTCRTLDVSHGFHSARVAPAAAPLRQAMDGLEVAAARRTLVSTTTGGLLAPEIDPRELLATGVSQPVRFLNAVRRADELRPDLWVEIGPGDALSGLVTEIIGGSAAPVLTTDRPGRDGFAQLNTLLMLVRRAAEGPVGAADVQRLLWDDGLAVTVLAKAISYLMPARRLAQALELTTLSSYLSGLIEQSQAATPPAAGAPPVVAGDVPPLRVLQRDDDHLLFDLSSGALYAIDHQVAEVTSRLVASSRRSLDRDELTVLAELGAAATQGVSPLAPKEALPYRPTLCFPAMHASAGSLDRIVERALDSLLRGRPAARAVHLVFFQSDQTVAQGSLTAVVSRARQRAAAEGAVLTGRLVINAASGHIERLSGAATDGCLVQLHLDDVSEEADMTRLLDTVQRLRHAGVHHVGVNLRLVGFRGSLGRVTARLQAAGLNPLGLQVLPAGGLAPDSWSPATIGEMKKAFSELVEIFARSAEAGDPMPLVDVARPLLQIYRRDLSKTEAHITAPIVVVAPDGRLLPAFQLATNPTVRLRYAGRVAAPSSPPRCLARQGSDRLDRSQRETAADLTPLLCRTACWGAVQVNGDFGPLAAGICELTAHQYKEAIWLAVRLEGRLHELSAAFGQRELRIFLPPSRRGRLSHAT